MKGVRLLHGQCSAFKITWRGTNLHITKPLGGWVILMQAPQ